MRILFCLCFVLLFACTADAGSRGRIRGSCAAGSCASSGGVRRAQGQCSSGRLHRIFDRQPVRGLFRCR